VAVSNERELRYVQTEVSARRSMLVSNGISRAQFEKVSNLSTSPRRREILRITYIGKIGLAQNLATLVQATAGLREFEVAIVGNGNDESRVRELARDLKADNIRFLGAMPWNDAASWYGHSDVVYCQLSEAYATAVPSKLYEYLSTGLPVVYGGTGAGAEFLRGFEGVHVVAPDDPAELAAVFKQLAGAPSRGRLASNVEKVGSNFIREMQVARFEATLAAMTSSAEVTPANG
jgi:glycosyltransferase involved in cell wall biosynthesis